MCNKYLTGHIQCITLPIDWGPTKPKDLSVAMDAYVMFEVACHSWYIVTAKEDILQMGGGPADDDPLLMIYYRSGLGGITPGLAAIGTLTRLRLSNILSIKKICDNKATSFSSKLHF
jgi:hypothetical protein